jgi:hypothetical protein
MTQSIPGSYFVEKQVNLCRGYAKCFSGEHTNGSKDKSLWLYFDEHNQLQKIELEDGARSIGLYEFRRFQSLGTRSCVSHLLSL